MFNKQFKVYLIGNATDMPYQQAYQRFLQAEEMLLELGQQVVNPLRRIAPGAEFTPEMKQRLPLLMGCNAVYVLPDAHLDKRARLEYLNADQLSYTPINESVIGELKTHKQNFQEQFNIQEKWLK